VTDVCVRWRTSLHLFTTYTHKHINWASDQREIITNGDWRTVMTHTVWGLATLTLAFIGFFQWQCNAYLLKQGLPRPAGPTVGDRAVISVRVCLYNLATLRENGIRNVDDRLTTVIRWQHLSWAAGRDSSVIDK